MPATCLKRKSLWNHGALLAAATIRRSTRLCKKRLSAGYFPPRPPRPARTAVKGRHFFRQENPGRTAMLIKQVACHVDPQSKKATRRILASRPGRSREVSEGDR
jgi:hypothetical protein